MKVKKAFIKTRRTETHVTSEAYAWGGDNHGDAIGFQASVFREPLLSPSVSREARRRLMIKLCNAGIIPVTQLDGLVCIMPNQNDFFWLALSLTFIVSYVTFLRPLVLA